MMKRILILSFVLGTTLFIPSQSRAAGLWEPMAAVEQTDESVSISVNQSVLHVTGAAGETLEVISLTGRHVMSVKIESPAQRIELNVPKGCYILKIGKVVRKVSLR